MALTNAEVVRAAWATLDRPTGSEWPPASDEEFRRGMRTDLYHEDIVIRNIPQFPVAEEYRGREGVLRWAAEVWEVFDELHNDLEELIEVDGSTIVTVQTTRGKMRHTGLEMDAKWAVVWRLRAGKVYRTEGYVTRREALAASGAED
jgi:ketosteroid isomerase-like protein